MYQEMQAKAPMKENRARAAQRIVKMLKNESVQKGN